MGYVISRKFGHHLGAVLTNDEFLNERRRQKGYLDMPLPLLTKEQSEAWGLLAVYAGCGNPAIHQEVVDETRGRLALLFHGLTDKKRPPSLTMEDVAQATAQSLQDVVRRNADLRLRLYYGFDGDDLNRGAYKLDGRSIPIKQSVVREKALQIVRGKLKDQRSRFQDPTRGVVFGHDERFGIHAYYLDPSTGNAAFNQEAYEAIGDGRFGAILSLADDLNGRSLAQRTEGLGLAEGLYSLLDAAFTAHQNLHTTRGDLTVAVIDGESPIGDGALHRIRGNQVRVAFQAVLAARRGCLAHETSVALVKAALVDEEPWKKVLSRLFDAAPDSRRLDLLLRDYKAQEVDTLVTIPTPKRRRRKRRSS